MLSSFEGSDKELNSNKCVATSHVKCDATSHLHNSIEFLALKIQSNFENAR
jgi:hypothetical protein